MTDTFAPIPGARPARRGTFGTELTAEFLDVVVCPSCHWRFAVDYENVELVCTNPHCGLAYPTRSGIPILLVDEARKPERS